MSYTTIFSFHSVCSMKSSWKYNQKNIQKLSKGKSFYSKNFELNNVKNVATYVLTNSEKNIMTLYLTKKKEVICPWRILEQIGGADAVTWGHSACVRNFQVQNDGGEEASGRVEQRELHKHGFGEVVHPLRGSQSLNLKHGLIPINAGRKNDIFMTVYVGVTSFISR